MDGTDPALKLPYWARNLMPFGSEPPSLKVAMLVHPPLPWLTVGEVLPAAPIVNA